MNLSRPTDATWYEKPEDLRPEQLDPLIRSAVERINRSGWVWTAESCQGHPDAETDMVWAGNTRPMLRLVCWAEDAGRMLTELAASTFYTPLDPIDRALLHGAWRVIGIELWPHKRTNPRVFEVVVYARAATVYERNLGIAMFERFAAQVAP